MSLQWSGIRLCIPRSSGKGMGYRWKLGYIGPSDTIFLVSVTIFHRSRYQLEPNYTVLILQRLYLSRKGN